MSRSAALAKPLLGLPFHQAFVGSSLPPQTTVHPPRPPPDPLSSSARQAKITTELSEIISGSESLKDENAEA